MKLDKSVVLADTVYRNGVIVAEDVSVSLPAVNPETFDFKAMGTVTLPMLGRIEAMEMTFKKIGVDKGLKESAKLEGATYEVRWAQQVVKPDGSTKVEGCKAFLRAVPKTLPGLGVDPGSSNENDIPLSVTRYQLFVDGKEYWLIDQLNQILRIDGKDYCKQLRSLL